MTDDLVATAIEAAGGQKLWNTVRGLTVDMSIGGPNMGDARVAAQCDISVPAAVLIAAPRAGTAAHPHDGQTRWE